MTWPKLKGMTAAERDTLSKARQQNHVKANARRYTPKPTVSWWLDLNREQLTKEAAKEFPRINALRSLYQATLERFV